VVCLKATSHAKLAAAAGLAGSAVLATGAGRFLLRRWRAAPDLAAFDEGGDVAFCGGVFLLSSIALAVEVARVTGIALSRVAPLVPLLLCAAAPFVRRHLRRRRCG
jgi:hypothetical protein